MNRWGTIALALFAVALTAHEAWSQQTRTVEGTVRSAADSTPLAGVRVRALETASRTETNSAGWFALANLPPTTVRIVFDRIGVMPDTVAVEPDTPSVSVFLQPRAVLVSPLIAEGAMPARQRFEAVAQTSTISLDPIELENAPTLLEPDVGRVAQLLPGTVAKNDYSVGINVRGGESDQNLIRLDGVTVLNPFHLGGLFSTFDVSAVDRVDLITGGFPARYGGRLSSVMDVELRRGSPTRMGVHGSVSLLASRIAVDGPVGGTGATFLVSARRTYADALAKAFSDTPFDYYFADGLAKLTVPVGRGHVSATGYWGRDAFDLPWVDPEPGRDGVDFVFSWGNRLAGISWLHPIGTTVLDSHLDISEFSTRFGMVPDQLDAKNAVRQITARTALAFRLGARNDGRVGAGIEDYRIVYESSDAPLSVEVPEGVWVGGERIPYDFREVLLTDPGLDLGYRPRVWFAYLDDQWRPFSALILRLGLRAEHVGGSANFTGLSPRIGAKAFVTKDLALTGSVGRYFQPIHSIRDQEVPITLFDFWIGADELTPVAQSDQVVLGFERWFGHEVSFGLEAYTKAYDDLPLRNPDDDPRVRGDEFLIATGNAWGFDLLIRRHQGAIRGWIAYSYAKATREAGGESFPPCARPASYRQHRPPGSGAVRKRHERPLGVRLGTPIHRDRGAVGASGVQCGVAPLRASPGRGREHDDQWGTIPALLPPRCRIPLAVRLAPGAVAALRERRERVQPPERLRIRVRLRRRPTYALGMDSATDLGNGRRGVRLVRGTIIRHTWCAVLLGTVWMAGCLLEDVTISGGEAIVLVSAVMRPDLPYQYVIVEQSLDGVVDRPDSPQFPVPPHAPRIPIENAFVTVENLDLPDDPCGSPVQFRHAPYAPGTPARAGLYWAPQGCPTMRPGDRLQLRVETDNGDIVTGITRVPGMRSAFVALRSDSVTLGGGDSVLTFNRDRDTLRFGVDPIVGRLLQLDVRRNGDLSDFGTKVLADTTEFLLAGAAIDVFVSGAGNDVFRGGRDYAVTLTLSDTNYFDFTRSSNNEFTGRGFINHLAGGIGVFGSAVAATSRVWVVADVDDPREGLYAITGQIETVPIDVELRVYLHRPTRASEVSAFLEGEWFTRNPNAGGFNQPEWWPKSVAGKSVDGSVEAERLYLAISDTLTEGAVWYTTLTGALTAADTIPLVVADSGLIGTSPIDTLLAVRLPTP